MGSYVPPYSSRVILRQSREHAARPGEGPLCSPAGGRRAGWWVSCPEWPGPFLGCWGRQQGQCVSGWGRCDGVPLEGSGPATTWGLGAQAKP